MKTTANQPTIRHLDEASASRVKLIKAFNEDVFARFAKAISKNTTGNAKMHIVPNQSNQKSNWRSIEISTLEAIAAIIKNETQNAISGANHLDIELSCIPYSVYITDAILPLSRFKIKRLLAQSIDVFENMLL